MRTPTKLQVFANFLPEKSYNPLSPPVLYKFISARPFSVPQVENEVKRLHFADVAEIQEAVTDELKKIQKEEVSAAYKKLYDRTKNCTYAIMTYKKKKKRECVILMRLRFLK
jgi:nitrate reductase assembly molybdenum cofactor insertion protein NarJ